MTSTDSPTSQDTFPYAYASKHLDAAVGEIRRGPLPTQLDSAFFTRAGLEGSAQSGVRRCFRAFGFTDEADTFTPRGQGLRSTGPEAQRVVLEALEGCYPHLWPRLASGEMKSEGLDDYVARHMGQSESARSSARRTLLWLVHQSGNEGVARGLEDGSGQRPSQTTTKKTPRKSRVPEQKKDASEEAPTVQSHGNTTETSGLVPQRIEAQRHLDRFGVLAQVLNVNIDSSSSPELVCEVRKLLVALFGSSEGGNGNANTRCRT